MTAPHGDEGTGLIGTIGGVTVFLVLLSFAVQVLFNAYANSAITAAAHDAAHIAAEGGIDHRDGAAVEARINRAEDHARTVLGGYGDRVEFRWTVDDDTIRLTVVGRHPHLAIDHVSGALGLNRIERTVEVRVERPR